MSKEEQLSLLETILESIEVTLQRFENIDEAAIFYKFGFPDKISRIQ